MDVISLIPLALTAFSPNKNPVTSAETPFISSFYGTGFFYQKGGIVYLITNRHVITKRDMDNNLLPGTKGDVPEYLEYIPGAMINNGGSVSASKPNHYKVTCPLYDESGHPRWLIHPTHKVDVVAIPAHTQQAPNADGTFANLLCINSLPMSEDMKVSVADDVFVVGYPNGKTAGIGSSLAVWKRATIASEPEKSYYPDGRQTCLIDTTTRSGMSGSPVFCRHNNSYFSTNGACIMDGQPHNKFLGVYSSRIDGDQGPDSFLGLIWKAPLIEEIINGNKLEDNAPERI